MKKLIWGFLFFFFGIYALFHSQCGQAREIVSARKCFSSVVFIGASGSSGAGTDTTLADLFDERISVRRGPIANLASKQMHVKALENGKEQVSRARELNPSLVVALDFLFWYAYGWKSDDSRLACIEEGLRQLATFQCPVVVGTVPNMLSAEGKALPKSFIPSEEIIGKINQRIIFWATKGEREDIILLPVAQAVEAQLAKQPYCLGQKVYQTDRMLQDDGLHPNDAGQAFLTDLLVYGLIQEKLVFPEDFHR